MATQILCNYLFGQDAVTLFKHVKIEDKKKPAFIDYSLELCMRIHCYLLTQMAMLELIKENEPFEGVVLGCTELSVLHHHFPLSVPDTIIFDPLRLSAEQFIQ